MGHRQYSFQGTWRECPPALCECEDAVAELATLREQLATKEEEVKAAMGAVVDLREQLDAANKECEKHKDDFIENQLDKNDLEELRTLQKLIAKHGVLDGDLWVQLAQERDSAQGEIERLKDKCDEIWGAANYRLKYINALYDSIGYKVVDGIEADIGTACEYAEKQRAENTRPTDDVASMLEKLLKAGGKVFYDYDYKQYYAGMRLNQPIDVPTGELTETPSKPLSPQP